MKKLIEAFEIFLKYSGDVTYPTVCSHDTLKVCVDSNIYPQEAVARLIELGFFVDETEECFVSYKYGSA